MFAKISASTSSASFSDFFYMHNLWTDLFQLGKGGSPIVTIERTHLNAVTPSVLDTTDAVMVAKLGHHQVDGLSIPTLVRKSFVF